MTPTLKPGDAITRANVDQLVEGDVVRLTPPLGSPQSVVEGPIERSSGDWKIRGTGRLVRYRIQTHRWTATLISRKGDPVAEKKADEPLATWEAELLLDPEAKKEGALVELSKGDDMIRGRVRIQSGEARVGAHSGATIVALVRRGYAVKIVEKAKPKLPDLPTARGFYRPAGWGAENPALAFQLGSTGWRIVWTNGTSEPRTPEAIQREAGEKGLVKLVPAGSETAKAPAPANPFAELFAQSPIFSAR